MEEKRLQWQEKKINQWRKEKVENKWKGTPRQNREISANWAKYYKNHPELHTLDEQKLEQYRLNYQDELFITWAVKKTQWIGNSRQKTTLRNEWKEILRKNKKFLNLDDQIYIKNCIIWQNKRLRQLESDKNQKNRKKWLGNQTQRNYLPKLWKQHLKNNPHILMNTPEKIEQLRNEWQLLKIKDLEQPQ